jgi:5-methyltetrahydropteroyltriglutamate--homocysteine methyltransferase
MMTVAFRSEVVGSLLRPDYLKEAVRRFDAGEISRDELTAVQDRAAREAIALQEESGVDVITDGEMRRRSWTDPLTKSLSGYGPVNPTSEWLASHPMRDQAMQGLSGLPSAPSTVATAPLGRGPVNLPLAEMTFVQAHSNRPFKVTLPSLAHASVLWAPGTSDTVYPDRSDYMRDALELATELVAECVEHGATYVQLDSPRYTHLVSEEGRENFRKLGLDPSSWLGEMIALDNALVDRFPNVTWGLHLCRGNGPRGRWAVAGGYDAIAEQLFGEIHVDRLLLEYDSPRAGTFEPLRFIPPSKTAVLGLISTKEAEVETPELLESRIEEASRYVLLDRLALSPQCGFASAFEGNVTEATQRAKLNTLVKVAREVWA